MKPGNFALIIEIHDGHTTPLGVVDSVTTARRMVQNAVKIHRKQTNCLPTHAFKPSTPVFEIYRFTNGKPSYVWQCAYVQNTGFWCWAKTYKPLWRKPAISWKQLVWAGKK